jgi:hypothetical protein
MKNTNDHDSFRSFFIEDDVFSKSRNAAKSEVAEPRTICLPRTANARHKPQKVESSFGRLEETEGGLWILRAMKRSLPGLARLEAFE